MQDIEAHSLDFLCNKALAKSILQTANESDLNDYINFLYMTENPNVILIKKLLEN